MPKQRNFDKLYESLNIHREQETQTIPESERASNQCKIADHTVCDFLFEDYNDGRGMLLLKGKRIRITDNEFSKFSELMKEKNNEN